MTNEIKLTAKQLRALRYFADGETKTYRSSDVEAFFDLTGMGFIDYYFDGYVNDNVGTITEPGKKYLEALDAK